VTRKPGQLKRAGQRYCADVTRKPRAPGGVFVLLKDNPRWFSVACRSKTRAAILGRMIYVFEQQRDAGVVGWRRSGVLPERVKRAGLGSGLSIG
jgi:hypothetical protein